MFCHFFWFVITIYAFCWGEFCMLISLTPRKNGPQKHTHSSPCLNMFTCSSGFLASLWPSLLVIKRSPSEGKSHKYQHCHASMIRGWGVQNKGTHKRTHNRTRKRTHRRTHQRTHKELKKELAKRTHKKNSKKRTLKRAHKKVTKRAHKKNSQKNSQRNSQKNAQKNSRKTAQTEFARELTKRIHKQNSQTVLFLVFNSERQSLCFTFACFPKRRGILKSENSHEISEPNSRQRAQRRILYSKHTCVTNCFKVKTNNQTMVLVHVRFRPPNPVSYRCIF